MSDPCCLKPEELRDLIVEQHDADELDAHVFDELEATGISEGEVGQWPPASLASALLAFYASPPLWISAGCEASAASAVDPPESPRRSEQHLLRDALAHVSRVLIGEQHWPLVVRWDPLVTPALLDGASRFGSAATIVWVFATLADVTSGQLAMADWRRGKVVVGSADDTARRANLTLGPLRAMILMGAGTDVEQDAKASQALGVPRFAIGSTGSVAHSLLTQDPDVYSNGDVQLRHELATAGSYLTLMRSIASRL